MSGQPVEPFSLPAFNRKVRTKHYVAVNDGHDGVEPKLRETRILERDRVGEYLVEFLDMVRRMKSRDQRQMMKLVAEAMTERAFCALEIDGETGLYIPGELGDSSRDRLMLFRERSKPSKRNRTGKKRG